MIMRNKLTLLVLLLISTITFSQTNDPKLPNILPASPEASAITKNGQMSVGMFSGIAQAAIPLYEIKMKGFSLPIGLNYSGNGLKVDEIPSRVGLGWILN